MTAHKLSDVVCALLSALTEGQACADRYSESLRLAGGRESQTVLLRVPIATMGTVRLNLKFAVAEVTAKKTTKTPDTTDLKVFVEAGDLSDFAPEQMSSLEFDIGIEEFDIGIEFDRTFRLKSENA